MATETLSAVKEKYGLGERNVMKEKERRISDLERELNEARAALLKIAEIDYDEGDIWAQSEAIQAIAHNAYYHPECHRTVTCYLSAHSSARKKEESRNVYEFPITRRIIIEADTSVPYADVMAMARRCHDNEIGLDIRGGSYQMSLSPAKA